MSILVYTENWDGKFKKLTFELVSYASAIAKSFGTSCIALSIGNVEQDELKKLGDFGASKVIGVSDDRLAGLINSAYSSVIAQVATRENAGVIVLSNNFSGKALAPRVSAKLKAGMVAGVTALPSSQFSVYTNIDIILYF